MIRVPTYGPGTSRRSLKTESSVLELKKENPLLVVGGGDSVPIG
jgi:hypothetical protein